MIRLADPLPPRSDGLPWNTMCLTFAACWLALLALAVAAPLLQAKPNPCSLHPRLDGQD